MNRNDLMSQYVMAIRNAEKSPQLLARSARQATYKTCRKCNAMMIQAHKGGLECINCVSDTGIDFSGQKGLTDAQR